MSYCRNASQQISMDDSLSVLTEREKKTARKFMGKGIRGYNISDDS